MYGDVFPHFQWQNIKLGIRERCKVIKTVTLIAIRRLPSFFRITRYHVAYLNIFYYFRSTAKHTHDFLRDGIALNYH